MKNLFMKLLILSLPIASICQLSIVSPVGAEPDKTLSPYFFVKDQETSLDHFPLKATEVDVNINGVIADVEVTQVYANMGSEPITGSYIFPASTRAAVHGMTMTLNDEVVIAKIREKKEAKKAFEQAKKKGKSASLLQQQRPNVFSMDVANIMPGDTIRIKLQYTELLVPTDSTYQFVYPTVVGPRYSGQTAGEAAANDKWVKNPYLLPDDDQHTEFSIRIEISSGLALQQLVCPSHEVDTNWKNNSQAKIKLADSSAFGGDRDFILNYKLAGETIQSGIMLYEKENEKFFLMMVEPPEKIQQLDIPDREYIFIVDVSGSMNGFPLETSKELLSDLIGNLRVSDTFNVMLFAGSSTLMAPASLPATSENIDKAIQIIEQARGGGGTELLSAVQQGILLPGDEGVARTLVIITDGYISGEKEVFQLIRSNLNTTNFFAFGIGSSVNRYLIEGIAKAGNGEPFIVTKPEEAHRTARQFQSYLESPVLTDISIKFDKFQAYDTEPAMVGDLFARRPLVFIGKYEGAPRGSVTISGVNGKGKFQQEVEITSKNKLESNQVLPYLWARKRLANLSDFNSNSSTDETRAEVVSLGLSYNLLTKYTSFIAVHEQIQNPSAKSRDVKQPLTLPKHVSHLAVSSPVTKLPEPGLYILVIGICLFAALSYWKRKKTTKTRI